MAKTKIQVKRSGDDNRVSSFDDGMYRVKLTDIAPREDKWGGVTVNLKFIGGKYAGVSKKFAVFPGLALQTLFESAGYSIGRDGNVTADLDDLIGQGFFVALESREKNGKKYANIVKFIPPTDDEAELRQLGNESEEVEEEE